MATTEFDIQPFMKPYDFGADQKAVDSYLGRYSSTLGSQEGLGDMYSRLSGQVNLPSLKEQSLQYGTQLGDISSHINALPNMIKPTQGATMTQGQRDRAIASESAPLLEQYNKLGQQASNIGNRISSAEGEVSQRLGLGMAEQEKQLLPFEKEYDSMVRLQAAKLSGWSQEMSTELSRLVQNAQMGLEMSEGEKNRANELAVAEMGYENELKKLQTKGEQDRETNLASYLNSGAGLEELLNKYKY